MVTAEIRLALTVVAVTIGAAVAVVELQLQCCCSLSNRVINELHTYVAGPGCHHAQCCLQLHATLMLLSFKLPVLLERAHSICSVQAGLQAMHAPTLYAAMTVHICLDTSG